MTDDELLDDERPDRPSDRGRQRARHADRQVATVLIAAQLRRDDEYDTDEADDEPDEALPRDPLTGDEPTEDDDEERRGARQHDGVPRSGANDALGEAGEEQRHHQQPADHGPEPQVGPAREVASQQWEGGEQHRLPLAPLATWSA